MKDIESLLDPAVGETSIGSNGPLAAGFVSAVVETLTRRHPRASVQVMDAVLDRLLRELRDRNIDLAIGTSIAPISDEDMESELLFRDRLVIVAGVSSKWAGRRKIRPDELLGEPWTFPPAGSIPGTNIANAFQSAGLSCPQLDPAIRLANFKYPVPLRPPDLARMKDGLRKAGLPE